MTAIGISVLLLGSLAELPIAGLKLDGETRRSEKVADAEDRKDSTPKKSQFKFTINKKTTYITGPLDKEGHIDYAAALNERMRQGVTPENNANVLLWKALGPHPEGTPMPPEFFRLMGLEPPPDRGDYYIPLPRYVREHLRIDSAKERKEIDEQLHRSMRRLWTPMDYPKLAAWLKANEEPLALVIRATKRTRYFVPLVARKTEWPSSGLMEALMPGVQRCREIANALAARAMLRAGQGADAEAWEDLLACHRLGRMVGWGCSVIETLVGIAIDETANATDLAFLQGTRPNAQRIEQYLRELRNLPPHAPVADKVNLAERFVFLDNIITLDRRVPQYLETITGGQAKRSNASTEMASAEIDWDPALRNGNRWYDQVAAAMRERDRPTREKRLDQLESDLKRQVSEAQNLKKALRSGEEPSKAVGRAIGDVLIGLALPPLRRVQNAADRAAEEHDNLLLAFVLAWYQRDHGRYPKDLGLLAPKYLEQVPQDLFSGKGLIYRPRENGYLLYSVGPNGKDEEGRGPEDMPPGDDLSVRMPLPEPPKN